MPPPNVSRLWRGAKVASLLHTDPVSAVRVLGVQSSVLNLARMIKGVQTPDLLLSGPGLDILCSLARDKPQRHNRGRQDRACTAEVARIKWHHHAGSFARERRHEASELVVRGANDADRPHDVSRRSARKGSKGSGLIDCVHQ